MENYQQSNVYVRFNETDATGTASTISYFVYMEEARSKFFQAIGFEGREKRNNIDFILASSECDFLASAFAGQTLSVITKVDRIGTKSFTLRHEMHDAETGLLIAAGKAAVVCFDFRKQRSEPVPEILRGLLEEFLVPA